MSEQYVVIYGTPGKDALAIVGPFATAEAAGAYRVAHPRPGYESMVDILNAPEAAEEETDG